MSSDGAGRDKVDDLPEPEIKRLMSGVTIGGGGNQEPVFSNYVMHSDYLLVLDLLRRERQLRESEGVVAKYYMLQLSRSLMESQTNLAKVMEGLRDFVDNGLRCDLNPTHCFDSIDTVEDFWHSYIRSVDEMNRERAAMIFRALATDSAREEK